MSESGDPVVYMDAGEFQSLGFLQELNRQFLHPLGLALEVTRYADGKVTLGGIWDYRDDPEGMMFDVAVLDAVKAAHVQAEYERHREGRLKLLGAMVQPVPGQ